MSAHIYLAGPIEHEPDGGVQWRREAALLARASTTLIDPTHYDGAARDLTPAEIVTRDRYLLRQSDGVVFDARSRSAGWGTAMELLDAYQLGKPTVGWGAPEKRSAFLEFHCTRFCSSLAEALDYMEALLGSDAPVPEREVAWAGGIFEGEGTVILSPRTNGDRGMAGKLRVAMTDEDSVARFATALGLPAPTAYDRSDRGHKTIWSSGTARRAEVIRVLGLLMPYLGERRTAKAQEVLAWYRAHPPYERVARGAHDVESPAILTAVEEEFPHD
ncbi:MAG: nucleoside 2-deoxyribosyltransferase [Gemmatimonadales bacterium]